MKVTRDVIIDLLPAYFSGEGSADTGALVEEFFKQDPEFAELAKEKKSEELLKQLPVNPLPKDHERETLIRTKNMLQWRKHWLIMAIVFTLMPLSSSFSSKGLTWIMLRDAPYAANIFLIFAVASWIMFFRAKRKLRSSGI
jgi:anti-sigma factor RsiW